MASIELIRFENSTVSPKSDRILYEKCCPGSGIFSGCDITYVGGNKLHITEGRGIYRGNDFIIYDQDINAQLSAGGAKKGRLYIRINLSDISKPIQILTVAADTLPALANQTDFNDQLGIGEMELAIYNVTETLLSGLTKTYKKVSSMDDNTLKTLSDVMKNTDNIKIPAAIVLKELNTNLSNCKIFTEGSGADTKYYIQTGADAASKKELGKGAIFVYSTTTGTLTIPDNNGKDGVIFITDWSTNQNIRPSYANITNMQMLLDKSVANPGVVGIVTRAYTCSFGNGPSSISISNVTGLQGLFVAVVRY